MGDGQQPDWHQAHIERLIMVDAQGKVWSYGMLSMCIHGYVCLIKMHSLP